MKRIEWLDFGKGITIFFVMLVHIIEGIYNTEGYAQYKLISEVAMALIFTFIMPVFFALSGYLYKSPANFSSYIASLRKKAISLFIPYILFSIIYVVLQHFSSDVHNIRGWSSLLKIYEQPISYLWFLYALFFVFVLAGLLSLLKIKPLLQLIIYFCLFVISQLYQFPSFLNLAFAWTICFYLGSFLKDNLQYLNKLVVILLVLLIIGSLVYQHSRGGMWYDTNGLSFVNFISKMFSIPVAFYLFKKSHRGKLFSYFTKFGKYSLIIYLVHAPTTSIVRILLIKVGLTNYFLLILLSVIFTWYLSVFVCYLSKNIKLVNIFFYPYKYLQLKLS